MPLYNLLVLHPAASAASHPATPGQTTQEREAWLASFGRKSLLSAALAVGAFGCMLLVLGYGEDLPEAAQEARSRNPLRFR